MNSKEWQHYETKQFDDATILLQKVNLIKYDFQNYTLNFMLKLIDQFDFLLLEIIWRYYKEL